MAKRIGRLLVAVLAVADVSAVGLWAARQSPLREAGFVIDLDSTGGFIGRGRGGVTIASDGSVRASRFGTNRATSVCRGQLTDGERQALRDALAGATRQPWPATLAPPGDKGCCDRYKWTLRVQQRDAGDRVETFLTTWFDGNQEHFPKELVAINDIAVGALTRTLAGCGRS
jgi:hypothetical protein